MIRQNDIDRPGRGNKQAITEEKQNQEAGPAWWENQICSDAVRLLGDGNSHKGPHREDDVGRGGVQR